MGTLYSSPSSYACRSRRRRHGGEAAAAQLPPAQPPAGAAPAAEAHLPPSPLIIIVGSASVAGGGGSPDANALAPAFPAAIEDGGRRFASALQMMGAERAQLLGALAGAGRRARRDVWRQSAPDIALRACRLKFQQGGKAMRAALLATGETILIHASDDAALGASLGRRGRWRGGNAVGVALMQARALLAAAFRVSSPTRLLLRCACDAYFCIVAFRRCCRASADSRPFARPLNRRRCAPCSPPSPPRRCAPSWPSWRPSRRRAAVAVAAAAAAWPWAYR
jgi:hypothetical protein